MSRLEIVLHPHPALRWKSKEISKIDADLRTMVEQMFDAFDLDGQQFELELEDLPARVVQHEYDHVEGVMFTDRVPANAWQKLQPLIEDLETQFRNRQKEGLVASDDSLRARLLELQKVRTAQVVQLNWKSKSLNRWRSIPASSQL